MHIDEKQVIVRSACYDAKSTLCERCGQCAGICNYLPLVDAEFRLRGFLQADGLRRNDVFERTALHARKCDPIEVLRVFLAAENEASAGASQSLMRGCRNEDRKS